MSLNVTFHDNGGLPLVSGLDWRGQSGGEGKIGGLSLAWSHLESEPTVRASQSESQKVGTCDGTRKFSTSWRETPCFE